MDSDRQMPSTFARLGRISAPEKTSNIIHACYVVPMVGILPCLYASCDRRRSWSYGEQCEFRDFHFSFDDIHSEHMLNLEDKFHVHQNPPLILGAFTERSLP
jgi:hypothetical protein